MKQFTSTILAAAMALSAATAFASAGDRDHPVPDWVTVVKTTAEQDKEYSQPKPIWERDKNGHDRPAQQAQQASIT